MDFTINLLKEFFQIAPGPAAIVIVAFMYFKFRPANGNEKYVEKTECHSHIDGLKKDINDRFKEMKDDMKEIRDLIIGHITK